METAEMVDWDEIFKRQRAIQGVCGKTQPDFSEQWIQRLSHSSGEKVRALQKTRSEEGKSHSTGAEVLSSDWLDSPNVTAEARLRRIDSEHPKPQNATGKRKDADIMIQWKATSQSVPLFKESRGNLEKESRFLPSVVCRLPSFALEQPREKARQLIATPASARWPQACEKMRAEASEQIRQLADHLESLRESGRNLLAFCGLEPGCGCTTILLLCGREISHRGLKTLWVDGNFSHPSLAEALQLSAVGGWESLLVDEDHAETTLWSLEPNLDLLPLDATSSERAKHLFRDACFSDWTDAFRNHYDLVLIDSGSLAEQEKLTQLKQFDADGVFLIVDNLEKSQNSLAMLRRSLAQHAIAFLGLAENHVP